MPTAPDDRISTTPLEVSAGHSCRAPSFEAQVNDTVGLCDAAAGSGCD